MPIVPLGTSMCCPIFEVEHLPIETRLSLLPGLAIEFYRRTHRSFVRSTFFFCFITVELVIGPSRAFAVQRSRALSTLCTQSPAQPCAIRRTLLSKRTGICLGSSRTQAIRSVNELPLREPGIARLHRVQCSHTKPLTGLRNRNEA